MAQKKNKIGVNVTPARGTVVPIVSSKGQR